MQVRMNANVIWIEGARTANPSFVPALRKKGLHIEVVPSGSAALELIDTTNPHFIIINAASFRSSGIRVCRTIRISAETLPIIVIENPDHPFTDNTLPNVILSLPFTSRKLVNRIKPFVPAEGKNVVVAGPIKLDLERKNVVCEDREAQLNPRLTSLLQTLMEHVGDVVLREELFRHVWRTEYTGDTRTLDVHISWLRSAIEENPRKPKYLKTIRGVGYRLDIE